MAERRTFTNEFKRQAVELVTREGLSVAEAARRLGASAFPVNGSQNALEEENQRLRAENARLQMERDILKKATAFFAKESK
jgi:transposase